jgi:dolichol-phosphate mannosyltransferase
LFIDNNSSDGSLEIIKRIIATDKNVYLISLSSNYGYQNSLSCALNLAIGDIFVMIDVDCEDPPELIPVFLSHYFGGYDVVYGERVSRKEPLYLIWARKMYYKIARFCADDRFNLYMAEFCLISNDIRLAVVSESNTIPFIRSSIARVGVHKAVPYTRALRISGSSKYNLWRMFVFGIAGILTSSTLPLRFVMYSMPFFAIAIILVGLFFRPISYTTLFLMQAIFMIYCLFSLSFIAVYQARIYKNTLNRPKYFVNQKLSVLQQKNNQER